jgi:hypothetical protein
MELPIGPFQSVGIWAPALKGSDTLMPASDTRQEGVTAYAWSLADFCKGRMLKFLFADADNETSQLSFVVRLVEDSGSPTRRVAPDDHGFISVIGNEIAKCGLHGPGESDRREHIELTAGGRRRERGAFMRSCTTRHGTAGHLIRAIPPAKEDSTASACSMAGGSAATSR